MFPIWPSDHVMTAKDRRFQAILITGFFFFLTFASMLLLIDAASVTGVLALVTLGSGLYTAWEHRNVIKERNKKAAPAAKQITPTPPAPPTPPVE